MSTTRSATKPRAPSPAKRLEIALEALNSLAAWNEGPVVTGKFDEPGTAQTARVALGFIKGDLPLKDWDARQRLKESERKIKQLSLESLRVARHHDHLWMRENKLFDGQGPLRVCAQCGASWQKSTGRYFTSEGVHCDVENLRCKS